MQLWTTDITTTLGPTRIVWSAKGVCRVDIGADPSQLPEAPGAEPGPHNHPWVHGVRALLDDEPGAPAVPLDLQGTDFQQAVWLALQAIPKGETRTYAQLAEPLGGAAIARAVGQACATNPIAVIVPCHRVVRSDGELGGFRWGLSLKRTLLDREQALPQLSLFL